MPSTEELLKATRGARLPLLRNSCDATSARQSSRPKRCSGTFTWLKTRPKRRFFIAHQRSWSASRCRLLSALVAADRSAPSHSSQRSRKTERTGTGRHRLCGKWKPATGWSHTEKSCEQIARLPEHERIVVVMRYVEVVASRRSPTDRKAGGNDHQAAFAGDRAVRDWLVEVQS